MPLPAKIKLLRTARAALGRHAQALADLSAIRKGHDPHANAAGEEWMLGPWAAAYGMTTLLSTLETLARDETPRLRTRRRADGRLATQVFPTNAFENLLVHGLIVEVLTPPGAPHITHIQPHENSPGAIALVLGAGNVVSIPILDTLHKLYAENQVVLLKMNPVNDYAGPLIEQILAPYIDAGFLRLVYGDAAVGAAAVQHPAIDEIHITGSARTHDAIVFGSGADGAQRKARGEALLNKRITSELGGVSPVIVVPGNPGDWTAADFHFQAENIVSQRVVHNGYNCCSSQVLVLPQGWSGNEPLLNEIRRLLRELPARAPYYPGSAERGHAALQAHPHAERFDHDPLRALITNLDPNAPQHAFVEEAFCPVLAQTALPAPDVPTYLRNAVRFANEKLSGTLSATLLIDPRTARTHATALDAAIDELRYGSIGVNIWGAGGFLLPGAAWGAHPGHTIHDIGSGIGMVHNAYLIRDAQKTVMRASFREMPRAWRHGAFSLMPKPLWFITHRNALEVAQRVTRFSLDPSWRHMPRLLAAALRA